MKYKVCNKCKNFVQYKPKVEVKRGMTYTIFKCPECGYKRITSINHIHYGKDGEQN